MRVHQLQIDMPVRWSSTYIITTRAKAMRDVWNTMLGYYYSCYWYSTQDRWHLCLWNWPRWEGLHKASKNWWFGTQSCGVGASETLQRPPWCTSSKIVYFVVPLTDCNMKQHTDNAQHAFLSDQAATLHLALPALEALHKARCPCSAFVMYPTNSRKSRNNVPLKFQGTPRPQSHYNAPSPSPSNAIIICSTHTHTSPIL